MTLAFALSLLAMVAAVASLAYAIVVNRRIERRLRRRSR